MERLLCLGGCGLGLVCHPEGDECAIVATITTDLDYEETVLLLRRNLQRRLASRDLEVLQFDVAVDEVTAGQRSPRCGRRSADSSRVALAWCSNQDRTGPGCPDSKGGT